MRDASNSKTPAAVIVALLALVALSGCKDGYKNPHAFLVECPFHPAMTLHQSPETFAYYNEKGQYVRIDGECVWTDLGPMTQ